MIYICIPARDEARTVGLVLWKLRKVFGEFGREYQLLVVEDGSTDGTAEALDPYANVLPLTLVRHAQPRGYAASVEALLRLALERSDRPRRDCAVLMHADFTHGPEYVPDLVRRIDSGADLVVAEGQLAGEPSRGARLLRRWAPLLLRGAVRLPGVRDLVSGFFAVRLSSLRLALRQAESPLLGTEGWAANAELIARLGAQARRVEAVRVTEHHDRRPRPSRLAPLATARQLWQARARVRAAGEGAQA
jgi:dolichol-phosphate mannosyltransferase